MGTVVVAVATVSGAVMLGSAAPAQAAGTVPGAPTITGVTGGIVSGELQVAYQPPVDAGGAPITDYQATFDGGANWWPCGSVDGTCTLTSLTNGISYNVQLRAQNSFGLGESSAPVAGTPQLPAGSDPDRPSTLPKARMVVTAKFTAASNNLGVDGLTTRLGVGTLPELTFSHDIANKAAVERHLLVTATGPDGVTRAVRGAWGWMSDRRAIFRPARYWPGRSTIKVVSNLAGVILGTAGKKTLVGSSTLAGSWSFRTARSLIATVDGETHRMTVKIDGRKAKAFGVSLGKDEWETRVGTKVISTDKEPTHTYTSTALNLDPAQEAPYELKDIPWNTRLTPTGEFIHSAPWAYSRIGRWNGSHGCTNMFEEDAKWIYDRTIPGDVVVYRNTGGESVQSWNGPGGLWNIPWDQWLLKSALNAPGGKPDTGDATHGSGGSSASA